MTALKIKNEEAFEKLFPEGQEGLGSIRKKAGAELKLLKRPNIKSETWKYTSTRWVDEKEWSLEPELNPDVSSLPQVEIRSRLVFLDGVFRQDLSFLDTKEVSVTSLEEVAREKKELLGEVASKFSEEETSYFPLMNEAFLKEGSFIHVSPAQEKLKLDFTFLWSPAEKAKALFTKNFLYLEKNASLVVKETHKTLGSSQETEVLFSSSCVDAFVGEGACLRYKKIFHTAKNHRHLAHLRSYVAKNASFDSFMVSLGATTFRQDTLVRLAEESAHTTLNGLYLSHDKNTTDFSFDIKHEAPRTTSHQYFKGFACEEARGVFQGNITVSEEATLTRSRQLNKNLILGQAAEIYTKPQLQIDTDDVKCSHGATVSQVREDELFYLQTRGLTKEAATSFLIAAFFGELLEIEKESDSDICEEEIKNTIREIVPSSLS